MKSHIFPLSELKDVEEFERQFDLYLEMQTRFPLKHISITKAYMVLQTQPNGSRLFAALIDIMLTFGMIRTDLTAYVSQMNKVIECDGTFHNPIVNKRTDSFNARMQMHHHANGFVLRYRSVWDKIMGFIVQLTDPEEYDFFMQSKSRKKAFRKFALKTGFPPIELVDVIQEAITNFDNKFRTSEAHGTGVLRKSSFVWSTLSDDPQSLFIGYWNSLNSVVHLIGKLFDKAEELGFTKAQHPADAGNTPATKT